MNGTPAATTYSNATPLAIAAVGSAGTNATASRSDHTHQFYANNRQAITFFIHDTLIGVASGTNYPAISGGSGGVECYLPDVTSVVDGAIWIAQQIAGSDAVTITYTSTLDGADSVATAIGMTITTTPTKIDLTAHLQAHNWSGVRGKRFLLTAAVTAGAPTNDWGAYMGGMNVVYGVN